MVGPIDSCFKKFRSPPNKVSNVKISLCLNAKQIQRRQRVCIKCWAKVYVKLLCATFSFIRIILSFFHNIWNFLAYAYTLNDSSKLIFAKLIYISQPWISQDFEFKCLLETLNVIQPCITKYLVSLMFSEMHLITTYELKWELVALQKRGLTTLSIFVTFSFKRNGIRDFYQRQRFSASHWMAGNAIVPGRARSGVLWSWFDYRTANLNFSKLHGPYYILRITEKYIPWSDVLFWGMVLWLAKR